MAYVDPSGRPVLVDATTGEVHEVDLPDFPAPEVFDLTEDRRRGPVLALSPDGLRLAYPTTTTMEREPGQLTFVTAWYRVVDLTTGESDLVEVPPWGGTPLAMSWTADGRIAVDLFGRPTRADKEPGVIAWTVDPATGDSDRAP